MIIVGFGPFVRVMAVELEEFKRRFRVSSKTLRRTKAELARFDLEVFTPRLQCSCFGGHVITTPKRHHVIIYGFEAVSM